MDKINDSIITFNDYLLQEEKRHKNSKGRFTLLLNSIQEACKIISAYIKTAGIQELIGETANKNASGEIQVKLDRFSNQIFSNTFKNSDLIFAFASEEEKEISFVNQNSDYILIIDPLDGSKQSQAHLPSGTIFALYKKNRENKITLDNLVASGYCLYSSSTIFTYATKDGIAMFVYDYSIGAFILERKNWKMPSKGSVYSTNEAYTPKLFKNDLNYLDFLKTQGYSLRYVGTLIADMHRILLEGGVFLYPANKKSPQGKLRLLFEVLPFGFMIKQTGGEFLYNKTSTQLINSDIHKRSSFVAGGKTEMEKYKHYKLVDYHEKN